MRLIIFILTSVWLSCAIAQKPQTRISGLYLSKEVMQADFAFLQSKVNTHCSFLSLLEKRSNVDIDSEFNKLKNEINTIHTLEEFVAIVNKALLTLDDKHSKITDKPSLIAKLSYYKMHYIKSETTFSDTLYADYYYSLVTDSIYEKARTGIRTKYINQKYYNVRPFSYNGKTIKAGEEINAIDNVPIHQFIYENKYSLYNLLWDPINRQWYDDYFMMALPQIGKKNFVLTIGSKNIPFNSDKTMDNLQKEYPVYDIPQVMILNPNILYIRMPRMNNAEWYLKNISEIYRPSISKIIFDVRGNGGGSDGVWHKILSKLIDKPLAYHRNIGIKNNEQTDKIDKLRNYKRDNNGNISTELILYPDEGSLHFKGRYYVLQDKYSYSAASALSSFAWQRDEMKLIGEPSAFINGYQMPPLMFTLPHSRITFNLGHAIDLSGGTENPYMDKVEKIVSENIDEYLERILFNDSYSYEYLNSKDKFIQAVIED